MSSREVKIRFLILALSQKKRKQKKKTTKTAKGLNQTCRLYYCNLCSWLPENSWGSNIKDWWAACQFHMHCRAQVKQGNQPLSIGCTHNSLILIKRPRCKQAALSCISVKQQPERPSSNPAIYYPSIRRRGDRAALLIKKKIVHAFFFEHRECFVWGFFCFFVFFMVRPTGLLKWNVDK